MIFHVVTSIIHNVYDPYIVTSDEPINWQGYLIFLYAMLIKFRIRTTTLNIHNRTLIYVEKCEVNTICNASSQFHDVNIKLV